MKIIATADELKELIRHKFVNDIKVTDDGRNSASFVMEFGEYSLHFNAMPEIRMDLSKKPKPGTGNYMMDR